MKTILRVAVSLGVAAFIATVVGAQTSPTAPVPPTAPVTPTAPAPPPIGTGSPMAFPTANITRTAEAVISAVDAKANSLSLQVSPLDKSATPQVVLAVPEPKCRFTKNNRTALLSDFRVGDKVVVRLLYRTAPVASVTVREMADAASYAEAQRQGKEITEGKITAVSARELAVLRADGVSVVFRVSAKTLVAKDDALVTLAAYPVGSSIVAKPRRLPAGSLMAVVIAENEEATNRIYRDTLTTWKGSVEAVNGDEKTGATVRMKRDDGAIRSFRLPVNVAFQSSRGDIAWAKMVGMNVSAHLLRRPTGSAELRTADAIKVTGASPEDAVQVP